MGYTTEFYGQVTVDPPFNEEEITFLTKFNETRRMNRSKGPYYVDGTGDYGQHHDSDIIDYNSSDPSQPGLWCKWIPTEEGEGIIWDGAEKFYCAAEWMDYLIDHFIGSKPKAASQLPFLQGHICNGNIEAHGEEHGDFWFLQVENNIVSKYRGEIVPVIPAALSIGPDMKGKNSAEQA